MDDKPVQEQQENTPVVGGSVGDIAITSCPAYEATTSFTATSIIMRIIFQLHSLYSTSILFFNSLEFIAHQELDEKP